MLERFATTKEHEAMRHASAFEHLRAIKWRCSPWFGILGAKLLRTSPISARHVASPYSIYILHIKKTSNLSHCSYKQLFFPFKWRAIKWVCAAIMTKVK